MKLLTSIHTPADLKPLSLDDLTKLAAEIREEIVSVVSQTGGHLATNLGSVELTVALHYVFNAPVDKLIWDVSNQTYAHKMLTGRRGRMLTLRHYEGLSGFSQREESEYDHFGAGHASTSISAALGFAAERDRAGEDHKVVAIIGDGAMTGGLAYEGLNNAGSLRKDLLVILNDNTWSISRNVGAISRYLTSMMADEKFNKLRNEIWELTGRFKRRDKIRAAISNIEDSIKGLLVPGMLFEKMGFRYFGPIDGHDLSLLIKTLQQVKNLGGPMLLHVATVKGKGYEPAESDPFRFHGVGQFDKITGKATAAPAPRPVYTKVFGDTMLELAAKDDRVVAITAAMVAGTGLVAFAEKYPDRFFDVGIAEGHAGTFAAGLAAAGARPYLVVYSTFMQRAYDQVIHDIALQNLPVVLCMDRGGLAGDDGPTHHGVFDLSYLSLVPNLTVAVPRDGNELRSMLHYTIVHEPAGPVAIRYPRETVPTDMQTEISHIDWGRWETLSPLCDTVVLAVGTMVTIAQQAAAILAEKGVAVSVVNARFVKPLDLEMLAQVKETARAIITAEENVLRGGFGQAVADYLLSEGFTGKFRALGIPDRFVTHGSRELLLKEVGLDATSVAVTIEDLLSTEPKPSGGLLQRLVFRRNGQLKRRETSKPLSTTEAKIE
ncbi:MAG TPA: 1-deoxy-D-xylulose-5-phosphate synthase [Candidatus Deferrimicrobium sp.]|nr:1-deoxy-D-xylulose-5-phosphate synthase [Candidatus Deferrimicrobium sp.]